MDEVEILDHYSSPQIRQPNRTICHRVGKPYALPPCAHCDQPLALRCGGLRSYELMNVLDWLSFVAREALRP